MQKVFCSLGGDGHFLSMAHHTNNHSTDKHSVDSHIPDELVIGVNTDPQRSGGFLCDFQIHPNYNVEDLDNLMSTLANIQNKDIKMR